VTFELYECAVQAHHHVPHRHHHHHIPPIAGIFWAISNVCCCLVLVRLIRICLCGRRRNWGSQGADGSAAAPFMPSAQSAPVQGRIVNGVILPYNAPSAGPAAPPAPTAPVQPAIAGYCSSCGSPHPDGHKFCGACGHPLQHALLQPGVSSGPAYPQLQAPVQVQG
jgi:hypothetical protein